MQCNLLTDISDLVYLHFVHSAYMSSVYCRIFDDGEVGRDVPE